MVADTPQIVAVQAPETIEAVLRRRCSGNTLTVSDPREALRVISSQPVQLCILGDQMDRMEQFINQVRMLPRGAAMPILVVTRHRTHEELFKLGADAFIRADESEDQFLSKVGLLLGLSDDELTSTGICSDIGEDPYLRALKSARRLMDDNQLPAAAPRYPRIGDSESLADFISGVEKEFRYQQVSSERRDIPEGLEAIDVQAYIGQQISISERMESPPAGEPGTGSTTPRPPFQASESTVSPNTEMENRTEVLPSALKHRGLPAEPERIGVSEPGLPAVSGTMPSDGDEPEESALSDAERSHLSGNLEETPFWIVLATVSRNGTSGKLKVQSRGITRFVYFVSGDPIVVLSDAREDRLVELLYREGRLTEQQYQSASLTIGDSGRRAGAVLVDKGILSSRELFPTVRHHYETLLLDCFTWLSGEWDFVSEDVQLTERIRLDVPAAALIVEGARTRIPLHVIDALVPKGSMVLFDGQHRQQVASIDCSSLELEVLNWCNGIRTTDQLAQRFNVDEAELRAFFAGLLINGWVSLSGAGRVVKDEVTMAFADRANATGLNLALERSRILEKVGQVIEGTYFSILEVEPDAPISDVLNSYHRLKSAFSSERYVASEFGDLQEKLRLVNSVIEEAKTVLTDADMRESYRQALTDAS